MIEGYDDSELWIGAFMFVGPALLALWLGFRPLRPLVEKWARARQVPLTDETRPFVEDRLRRARRWRTIGFALGWVAPYAEVWITRSPLETGGIPSFLFLVGYLLGALAAEVWAAGATRPSGEAVLSSREITRYLPAGVLRWVRVTALVGVGLVPLYALAPRLADGTTTTTRGFAALGGLVAVLWVGAELVPRLVVRRRQAFLSPDLLRADDAVRSWSAHAITGILLAGMLLAVGAELTQLSATAIGSLRVVAALGSMACFFFAYLAFSCLSAYEWRWRVRRAPSREPT